MLVKKTCWGALCLSLLLFMSACASLPANGITSNSINHSGSELVEGPAPTATPQLSIPSQLATPTPTKKPWAPTGSGGSSGFTGQCITYSNDQTLAPGKNGSLAAPYGPAPVTSEAQQLTQQLFQLVNADRAACGLPPFTWDSTLASGALLHSWNMINCGFSHTCPDGSQPCQRIANEGFAGAADCGENIGEAGPYPTPWGGTYKIQESMANEPVGGWHRIHLFSTTLHHMGIGVVVASNGFIWFTEDMVS